MEFHLLSRCFNQIVMVRSDSYSCLLVSISSSRLLPCSHWRRKKKKTSKAVLLAPSVLPAQPVSSEFTIWLLYFSSMNKFHDFVLIMSFLWYSLAWCINAIGLWCWVLSNKTTTPTSSTFPLVSISEARML